MNKKIQQMFELQDRLNISTNGDKWLDGITKEDKVINWDRAVHLEAAELIESFPWKHWKSITQQPDISNAQIEAVDIWHFIMSSLLEVQHLLSDKDSAHFQKEFQVIFDNEDLLTSKSTLTSKPGFDIKFDVELGEVADNINKEWTIEEHKQIDRFLKQFEILESFALFSIHLKKLIKDKEFSEKQEIKFNTPYFSELIFKKHTENELNISGITNFYINYTLQFFIASKLVNLQLDDLYRIYLGKNLLNQFRQNNGYKDGSYVKMWNGEEDNVVMLRVIAEYPDEGYDEIYKRIEELYVKL